jgi:glutathione synthase
MTELLFVVNDLATLKPDQSTAGLMAEAEAQGAHTWVCDDRAFACTPSGIAVACRRWPGGAPATAVPALRAADPVERPADSFSHVWVRTNPGRATHTSDAWLQLLFQVADAGVVVRNAPSGLLRASSKLHLSSLPAGTVPPTWSSDDPARRGRYLDELGGPAVVKPALGTRGSGVVRLSPDHPDREALLEAATASGPALLQGYLTAAPEGDVRIHVVDGALLELDGRACAVRRIPGPGEWRSNVFLGGSPARAELGEAHRALVARVGPLLRDQGLWHVGLDVVGNHVVECNVYSPGGLGDAERFAERPFTAELVQRFLAD